MSTLAMGHSNSGETPTRLILAGASRLGGDEGRAMVDLTDIQIRDPFVLPVPAHGRYYLFGSTDACIWRGPATGFDAYWSEDLEDWSGPLPAFRPEPDFWSHTQYWAPEVHAYAGAYYMFATFAAEGQRRGTQVLRADTPAGPYRPWSPEPLTPRDWECLDGTLHLERGRPFLVFCHEWKDTGDGEIWATELDADLRATASEPVLLFSASAAPWARPLSAEAAKSDWPSYVTDGPFLHTTADGRLLMVWSSMGEEGYALGVASSASGSVFGPWHQSEQALWPRDGGATCRRSANASHRSGRAE